MLPAGSILPELKGSLCQRKEEEDFCKLLAIDISNTTIKCSAASRLFLVDLTPPHSALGKNTIENMQSGIIYGHVGQVQGLISRLRREIPGVTDDSQVRIIAHGGQAQLMAPIIPEIQYVNQYLALEDLRLAYKKLRG